MKIVDVQ